MLKPLFIRSRARLKLTPDGEALLPSVRAAFEMIASAFVKVASPVIAGDLVISRGVHQEPPCEQAGFDRKSPRNSAVVPTATNLPHINRLVRVDLPVTHQLRLIDGRIVR